VGLITDDVWGGADVSDGSSCQLTADLSPT
jgi:hypothetical protein